MNLKSNSILRSSKTTTLGIGIFFTFISLFLISNSVLAQVYTIPVFDSVAVNPNTPQDRIGIGNLNIRFNTTIINVDPLDKVFLNLGNNNISVFGTDRPTIRNFVNTSVGQELLSSIFLVNSSLGKSVRLTNNSDIDDQLDIFFRFQDSNSIRFFTLLVSNETINLDVDLQFLDSSNSTLDGVNLATVHGACSEFAMTCESLNNNFTRVVINIDARETDCACGTFEAIKFNINQLEPQTIILDNINVTENSINTYFENFEPTNYTTSQQVSCGTTNYFWFANDTQGNQNTTSQFNFGLTCLQTQLETVTGQIAGVVGFGITSLIGFGIAFTFIALFLGKDTEEMRRLLGILAGLIIILMVLIIVVFL